MVEKEGVVKMILNTCPKSVLNTCSYSSFLSSVVLQNTSWKGKMS